MSTPQDVERLVQLAEHAEYNIEWDQKSAEINRQTRKELADGIRALAAERGKYRTLQSKYYDELVQIRVEVERLREVVNLLLDGLDTNTDEQGGLTQEEWDALVAKARKLASAEEEKKS
jgi:hypothetical protein